MLTKLIIDTSFFIALAISDDLYHAKAKKIAKKHAQREWVTTWPVLTELSHILSSRSFLLLLQEQQHGLFSIVSFGEEKIHRIIELKKRYCDHDLDLADISLILLAEHLDDGTILTFDMKDFSYLRWADTHHFHNLCQTKEV